MMQADDWHRLVDDLRQYGVRFLSGGFQAGEAAPADGLSPAVAPEELIARISRSDEPRLRRALVAVLLLHPEIAPAVRRVARRLTPNERERLIHTYVAAVYLQQNWRTRLHRYLGEQAQLPPFWIDELRLPAPKERFGRAGLAALAEREHRWNRRADPYLRVSQQLFGQLLAERAEQAA